MTPYDMSNAALDSAITQLCLLVLAACVVFDRFPSSAVKRLWLRVPQFWRLVLDVVMILALQGVAAMGVAVSKGLSPPDQLPVWPTAVLALLMYIIGFAISGCLAPHGRWRHLGFVAAGVWLVNMIIIVFFLSWVTPAMEGGGDLLTRPGGAIFRGTMLGIGSAIFIGIIMCLGGALSYLFKSD